MIPTTKSLPHVESRPRKEAGASPPSLARALTGSFGTTDAKPPGTPVPVSVAMPSPSRLARLATIVPPLAPRMFCYLAVKNAYQDRPPYGEVREGHAQVIVPTAGYFGLSYGGYFDDGRRSFTMRDPVRLHSIDTVLGCALKSDGLQAIRAVEAALTKMSTTVPYDRKNGPNCLSAAAMLFAAGTGAVLTRYDTGGSLEEFSNDIHKDLIRQGVAVDRKDGKDVAAVSKLWEDMPDRDVNIRGGGVRAKSVAVKR